MRRLFVLGCFILLGWIVMAFAQQSVPPPASPEDQLQMALAKLRWLEQSRMQCENGLADMWAQAAKAEEKLKQQQKQLDEASHAKAAEKPKK